MCPSCFFPPLFSFPFSNSFYTRPHSRIKDQRSFDKQCRVTITTRFLFVVLLNSPEKTYLFSIQGNKYGVSTISRLLKITGLFCRISSLFKGSFANETYNFKEPTNRSHPIVCMYVDTYIYI